MVLRDRARRGAHRSVPGMWANKNAGDATKWTYEPDLTRQSRSAGSYGITSLRLTIQASERNKIGVFWDEQKPCSGSTWSEREDGCRTALVWFIYGGTPTSRLRRAARAPEERAEAIRTGSSACSRSPGPRRCRTGFSSTRDSAPTSVDTAAWSSRAIRRATRCVNEQCAAGCPANANIPNLTYPRRTGRTTGSGRTRGAHRLLTSPARTT